MRRFLRSCIFFLIAGVAITAWGQNQAPTDLFFVLHADSGTLVAQHDSGNHYILTLNNLPPDLTYFSDHPRHIVGSLLINKIGVVASKRWNSSFKGALSFREATQKKAKLMTTMMRIDHYVFLVGKDQVVAQVVLLSPRMDADRYNMKDILFQTDGMWYLPYLEAKS